MKPIVLPADRRRSVSQSGVSLIELMVALAIGVFLIAGALTVYAKTRDLYRTNEANARLQETARYAMSVIEVDVRMANYWGLSNRPDLIDNAAGPADDVPSDLATYEGEIDTCGNNWAISLRSFLAGSNNTYNLACGEGPASDMTAAAGSDTMTIRRAATEIIPAGQLGNYSGAIKVQASRVLGALFADTAVPSTFDPDSSETHLIVVRSYYVSTTSDGTAAVPSLRRKALSFAGGKPAVNDEEVAPGIEDMQVEYGMDSTGDQSADYYVPANLMPAADTPVAARVWLLVRAERPEVGFTDTRTYTYADRTAAATPTLQAGKAYAPADGFRRVLISKTIQLRNTRR